MEGEYNLLVSSRAEQRTLYFYYSKIKINYQILDVGKSGGATERWLRPIFVCGQRMIVAVEIWFSAGNFFSLHKRR